MQKNPASRKETISDQCVQVTVVSHVLAKCMNRHYHAQLTGRLPRHLTQVFQQAFVGNLAKLLQQLTVVPEVNPQHLRQAEHILAVRQRVRY